jgi:K+-sensing histidine kinase KdpD
VTSDDTAVAIATGVLTFFITAALVGVRGTIPNEVIVLVLALAVVAAGRWSGRRGGVVAAVMAATSFEFFFTKPYLSLKIETVDDFYVTIALLFVGLLTGGLSARAQRDKRLVVRRESDAEAVRRLLDIASTSPTREVERAVRDELMRLLELTDCSFTPDAVELPTLSNTGALPAGNFVHRRDGFQLPERLAIEVTARGKAVGSLVCVAKPGVGVDVARRRAALAAAHVLGLAMAAAPPRH